MAEHITDLRLVTPQKSRFLSGRSPTVGEHARIHALKKRYCTLHVLATLIFFRTTQRRTPTQIFPSPLRPARSCLCQLADDATAQIVMFLLNAANACSFADGYSCRGCYVVALE